MLPGELGQYREGFTGVFFFVLLPGLGVFLWAAGTAGGSAGVFFTLGVVLWIGSTGVSVRGIFDCCPCF